MGVYANARNATKSKITACFWELYQEKPIERITIRELTAKCGVGRGTFYNHFQDVYNVLEEIEARLSCSLNRMCAEVREDAACIQRFSRILYDYYGDEVIRDYVRALILERRDSFFANDYLETLRDLLMDVCVEDMESVKSEKERMMLEGAISALIHLLLNCICKSSLTMEETNELIIWADAKRVLCYSDKPLWNQNPEKSVPIRRSLGDFEAFRARFVNGSALRREITNTPGNQIPGISVLRDNSFRIDTAGAEAYFNPHNN